MSIYIIGKSLFIFSFPLSFIQNEIKLNYNNKMHNYKTFRIFINYQPII